MKNIIILFDGTGDDIGKHESNIAYMLQLLSYDAEQCIYYNPGVGTSNFFGYTLKHYIKMWMGQTFGWGIPNNIVMAYTYLMNMYKKGDKVYIFGFSRGAYTARAFAAALNKMGLLYKGNEHMLPEVVKGYLNPHDNDQVQLLKESICHPCSIHFLGLWDTVEARGLLSTKLYNIPDDVHDGIPHICHALSIDEKRYKFRPLFINTKHAQEVWFSGTHSDVGGWSKYRGLSNCSLKWMLNRAVAAGLKLIEGGLDSINTNPLGSIYESYRGLWKIWPPYLRSIPEKSKIHSSVASRIVEGYNPPNLPKEVEWVN